MTKSFSEHEREQIKQKLMQSCEECWGRFGYKKTSVSELCKMSGISTGAFYQFYDSKEMLFVDTMNMVHERFNDLIKQIMPQNPTKYEFADVLKRIFRELDKTVWILKLHEDYEILLRKLPPDYLAKHFQNDITDFAGMLEKYNLKPKVNADVFTTITWILVLSITNKPITGENYLLALDLMIDCIIEKLL